MLISRHPTSKCFRPTKPPEEDVTLPSGFDDTAYQLFETRYSTLLRDVIYHGLQKVNVTPVEFSVVHNGFWQTVMKNGWEPDTFQHFFRYLDRTSTLIDFGTWIGPTILYGSKLAGQVYGIEGDPVAYAEAKINVQANRAKNIHLQPGCVATHSQIMTMRSAAAGNSCSGLGNVSCGTAAVAWNVQCYTLPYLFHTWNIKLNNKTFIKIDIESYECQLLPSLLSWLLHTSSKPTLHIAMHSQISTCAAQEYDSITKLAYSYKTVWCGKHLEKNTLDIARTCHTGELVLSDIVT